VLREAVRLLTAQARYFEADALLKRLEQQTGSISLDLQRYRSRISGGLDDFEAALPAAREVAATSEDFDDHLWLSQCCGAFAARQRQRGSEAEATALIQEGEQALDRATELAPDTVRTWAERLRFLLRLGRQDDMESVLKQAVPKFDEQPGAMANLYVAANQPQRAVEQYQADLKRWPDDIELIRAAAEFCLRSGRPQLAKDRLQAIATGRLRVDSDQLIWARRMLALALLAEAGQDQLPAALALIEQNLQQRSESVLDLRTKALLLSRSDDAAQHEQASQILESLIQQQAPGLSDTRRLLAELYLADGDWTRALPHLRLATDATSLARYVQAMLARGQLDEAELGVARLEELAPGQLGTVVLRTRLLFRRGSYSQVENRIDTLASPDEPEAAEPRLLLTAAALLEDFGRDLLKDTSATTEESQRGQRWLERAEAYLRQYGQAGADQQMALVGFLARSDRLDEALTILESEAGEASVAAAAEAVGAFDKSTALDGPSLARLEAVFAALLDQHDRALPLLDAKARVMIAAERFAAATELYREILQQQPNNFAIKNNLAELLALRRKDLDEALQLIQETIQAMGPQPSLLDTRATVYWARGDYQQAVEDMQSVVTEVPRANRYYHLARAMQAVGNVVGARDALRQAQLRGLRAEDLHPLERADYRQLLEAFGEL
jgi:tetratricopeptide (TPR) repeat protein